MYGCEDTRAPMRMPTPMRIACHRVGNMKVTTQQAAVNPLKRSSLPALDTALAAVDTDHMRMYAASTDSAAPRAVALGLAAAICGSPSGRDASPPPPFPLPFPLMDGGICLVGLGLH